MKRFGKTRLRYDLEVFISVGGLLERGRDNKVMNRYLLLTNDTEALPNRATEDHVRRLMWGEHDNGVAGVREMTSVVKEFNGKITFFIDICGALDRKSEVLEVAKWLNENGQDVELHLHPEYLPKDYWSNLGLRSEPVWINQYEEADRDRLRHLIKTFSGELEAVIGRKVNAYRAGSFRWNSMTLEVLKECGIPMSFNNTRASLAEGQCPYAAPMQKPFRWSNGIIEVPVTERNFLSSTRNDWWVRYQYPLCSLVRYRGWPMSLIPYSVSSRDEFLVCLMHSWSFLYRDPSGYEYYRDDERKEEFRTMLKKMSRDFDLIDSRDLKDLIDTGKIQIDHTEDISKAVYVPLSLKRERLTKDKLRMLNINVSSGNGKDVHDDYSVGPLAGERFYGGVGCCLFSNTLNKYLMSDDNLRQYSFSSKKTSDGACVVVKKRYFNKIEDKQYVPIEARFKVNDFLFNGKLPVIMTVKSEQNINFGVFYYDSTGLKISSTMCKCNRNNLLDVPENATGFSIYLRLPEDFKSLELYSLAFTFMDFSSTHIIPMKGNAVKGNADGIKDCFRLSVHNLQNAKNGVVILFPENVFFNVKQGFYPGYGSRIAGKYEELLSDYTVIFVGDPYIDKQIKYSGSWFFDDEGHSVLPALAEHVKKIIGDEHGDILCGGFTMGAVAAFYFSFFMKASFCVCDYIYSSLLLYEHFKRLYLDYTASHGKADGTDEGQPQDKTETVQEPESPENPIEKGLKPRNFDGMLSLHEFVNAYGTEYPKSVYFNFYSGNAFNNVTVKEIALIDEKIREKFEYERVVRQVAGHGAYHPMPKDDFIATVKFFLSRKP